jgi:hypothetical protein
MTTARREFTPLTFREFVRPLVWLNRRPLAEIIEPYRWRLFDRAFERDESQLTFEYNLILAGRAKKNWKTADLILACLYALLDDSPGGNQVYDVANDFGQAQDSLELAKKLVNANPILQDAVRVRKNTITRRDGSGFIEVLPGQDAIGAHGKTYRLLAIDEIHGASNWDLLEALTPDPTRPDVQQWITSYASLLHRPGVPLFDLMQAGRAGTDSRMLFSWYGADFTTDADFVAATPEDRANPSRASWNHPGYLAQQQRRLPAHKYRRLHLNLPGLPEGSAYQAEPVMNAITRGVPLRLPTPGCTYRAFVDMSGGSSDAATLAIAHLDVEERVIVDRVIDQGQPTPFDPRRAVTRFVEVLKIFRIVSVTGDRYAGETFKRDFEGHGMRYDVAAASKSDLYAQLEPLLNAQRIVLPDVPLLEQQLLGLCWRGGRIDHPAGEHDDFANACAGVASVLTHRVAAPAGMMSDDAELAPPDRSFRILGDTPHRSMFRDD